MRSFVGSQCQQDHPFAFVGKERSNAVFTHVGGYCYRVDIQFFKECAGIHCRSISDVTTLCVSNDELIRIVIFDIFYCLFKCDPSFYTHAFIESQIGFVGDTQISCRVNDCFVECEDRIFFFQQMFRDFLDVSIKSYTKE